MVKMLKIMALAVVAVVLLGGLAFITPEDEEKTGPVVGRPSEYILTGTDAGADMYVLEADAYEGAPAIAPLWKIAGITYAIDYEPENPLNTYDVPWTEGSRISSEIAITFWDNPEVSIVAGTYADAVRMVPAAMALDAPLLIWGESTAEALWTLGTVMPDEVITCGEVPLKHNADVRLDNTTYFDWTIDRFLDAGISSDYLIVTNPGDVEGSADVPHLSAFAPLLSAYRNGLILTTECNGTAINDSVHNAYELMDVAAFETRYLAMVGDADALEFLHRHFPNYIEDGMPSENPVPADDLYSNRDDKIFTMEVAHGRLIAKSLPLMSRYFERLMFYDLYLAVGSGPVANLPHQGFDWNNNAMVYCALAAEFDTRSLNEVWKDFYFDGEFDAADDSAPAHGTYSGMPNAINPVVNEFTRANYIAINADHGNPGSTVTFNANDLLPLHPGVTFAVSCNLGRIDNLDEVGYSVEESIAYTFLEQGLLTYVAPTRVTYGVISTATFDPEVEQDDNKAGNGLCRLFYENLINNDMTVGEAFVVANNLLVNSAEWDEDFNDEEQAINLCVSWEYHVYGDPAFNPYEPVNEGS